MEIPESLARKIALFRANGRIFRHEDELFSEASWLAVMLGQGVSPVRFDPLVDTLPAEPVRQTLDRMAALMRSTAETMPTHEDWIARHCAAQGDRC
jgi:tryptophan halogenase